MRVPPTVNGAHRSVSYYRRVFPKHAPTAANGFLFIPVQQFQPSGGTRAGSEGVVAKREGVGFVALLTYRELFLRGNVVMNRKRSYFGDE